MMTDLPETLLQQLEKIAEDEKRTPADLLESLLSGYVQMRGKKATKRGTLADFARVAEQMGLRSAQPVDTAARSREILETEFPDYIRRNWDKPEDDLTAR